MVISNPPASAGAKIVTKAADETVNNNSTPQDDDELKFAIGANEKWEFRFTIIHIGNATADFRLTVTSPAGSAITYRAVGDNPADTLDEVQSAVSAGQIALRGATTRREIVVEGIVTNGATPGDVQLQWCQQTATAVDTKVLENSCLIANELGV